MLLSAVYAAAPYLIESQLLRQLEQRGFEEISIRADRPRWNTLQLSWLSLASRQGVTKWYLEASNASATINPLDLIFGDLPRLSIAQLYLEIDSRSRRDDIEQSEFELAYPSDAIGLMPVRSINVDQFQLDWRGQEERIEYAGHALLDRLADRANINISLSNTNDARNGVYYAALQMTRSGKLSATITTDQEAKILDFDSRLAQRKQTIEIDNATFAINSAGLNDMADALRLFEPPNFDMSAEMTATFQGHIHKQLVSGFPKQYRLQGEIQAKVDSVVAPFYSYDTRGQLHADFDIDHVSTKIALSEQSRIEIAPPDELLALSKSSPWLLPIAVDEPVAISIKDRFSYASEHNLAKVLQEQQWQFGGTVLLNLPLQNDKQWHYQFVSPSVDISDVFRVKAAYQLGAAFEPLESEQSIVSSSQLAAKGVLNLSDEQLNLSVSETTSWKAERLQLEDNIVSNIAITVAEPFEFDYVFDAGRWTINDAKLLLGTDAVNINNYSIIPEAFVIELKEALGINEQWNMNAELSAKTTVSKINSSDQLSLLSNAEFKISPEEIIGTHTHAFSDTVNTLAKGELTYKWSDARGGVNLKAEALPVADWADTVPMFIDNLNKDDLLLNDGALDLNLSLLLLDEGTKAKATLRLTGVTGAYETMRIDGLSARVVIDDLLELTSNKKSTFKFDQLDIGVPISNIQFDVMPEIDDKGGRGLRISDVAAELLDGSMALQDFTWYPQGRSELIVDVKGIQLHKILELQQQPGLLGTGTLDGRIPIILSSDKLSVENGELNALPPGGIIEYKSDEAQVLAKERPSLGLTLEALENFQYDELSAEVVYQPDGNTLTSLSIFGRNPSLENGRPVNLNVNIEQNLKSLLQSLYYTRLNSSEFLDKIDEYIQERLKRNADNE